MNYKAVVTGLVNVEKDYQEFDFGEILIDYERIYQRLKARKEGIIALEKEANNASEIPLDEFTTTLSLRSTYTSNVDTIKTYRTIFW